MSSRKNMLTAFSATVLAIGLAACGSDNITRQDVVDTITEEARKAGVNVHKDGAVTEAKEARKLSDAASKSADDAQVAVLDAEAAHALAVAARTDVKAAKLALDTAKLALDAAVAAAAAADTAATAAETARDSIDDDGSLADAKAAEDEAVVQRGLAATEATKASTQKDAVDTAVLAAEAAAAKHVLELFVAAGGQEAAVSTAAGLNGNNSGGTTAVVTWPADTPATDGPPPQVAVTGTVSIEIAPEGGSSLEFRTEAGIDPATNPKTATEIDPLGDFAHGYSISDGDIHAIVFTDITQEVAATENEGGEDIPAVPDTSYLAFGVWLQEDRNGDGTADDPKFGAFADGGSEVTAATYGGEDVTGTAEYNGDATGIYTEDDSVHYFQGKATLNANFGTSTDLGTITGMIDTIVAGGEAMDDVIYLNDAAAGSPNINATGGFSGDARMGPSTIVDNRITFPYNGRWSGEFYNSNGTDVAPDSVAGTFGVTGTDDMGTLDDTTDDVIRSYLGAFGAHCSDCD